MTNFLLLLTFCATFVSANYEKSLTAQRTRRVFFGQDALITEYPYYASLWICGAVILSEIWVMTVAHCVDNDIVRGQQEVFVGGNSITDSLVYTYSDFIIHPEFKADEHLSINDLALLKLDSPLEFSEKIQPAQLPRNPPPRHVVLVTRGIDKGGNEINSLQKVDYMLLTPEECYSMISQSNARALTPPYFHLEREFLCSTRSDDLPGVCNGDSGSPVFSDNILIGLHSMGPTDCEGGRVSFEVFILSYVPWIKYITGL